MTDFELGGAILLAAFLALVLLCICFSVYQEVRQGRTRETLRDLFDSFFNAAKSTLIAGLAFLIICALATGLGAFARWIFG